MDPELISFCLTIGLGFAAVILLAVVVKLVEVRRARHWPSTSGTVLKARVRTRRRTDVEGRSRFESEPLVTYEYEVNGRIYRGTRLSFAERISPGEIDAWLKRYPQGKNVTVYYNPADPSQAVLERSLPPVVVKGVLLLLVIFLGAALLTPPVMAFLSGWLAPLLPQPQRAPAVVLLAGMSLGTLLVAYAIQRQVQASAGWSAASGRVLSTQSEEYQSSSSSGKLHRPRVVYSFEAGGQQYIRDRMAFGWDIGWSSPRFFRGSLERYPEDSPVTVYYDPQNPSDCVLERRAAGLPVLLGCAVVLMGLALFAAGFFA
jgi:hypothetical protein